SATLRRRSVSSRISSSLKASNSSCSILLLTLAVLRETLGQISRYLSTVVKITKNPLHGQFQPFT
ncbi:MAG: hypothetical protein KDI79_04240, partial [Anaerolineae bacterium]|nr:hypothetical protein [Anaerolineae bacterium]